MCPEVVFQPDGGSYIPGPELMFLFSRENKNGKIHINIIFRTVLSNNLFF